MLKKINQKGFTIIEVLIVLAIAGVIMLVVFLAVPALQRNSRNTQRANDASLIAAAVNECLTNNNGLVASCNNPTAAQLNSYLDTSKLLQFGVITTGAVTIDNSKLTFGLKCNGNATQTAGAKSFTVEYLVETSSSTAPRCVGS